MKNILRFLKETKIISRVLVVLWVFFSSAGAGFDASQFVYTFPIMAIFFLLPAILIEQKKNPVWVKARNEAKIRKLEAEAVANQQRKEEAIRLQQLKEENDRLQQEADLATLAFDGVRTGEIPIVGIDTSDYSDYDDYDEFDPDDVSSIDGMEGHDFEYFCADLLRRNGFSDVSVTKGSSDQGVDVLATKGGIKYAIQCKNYASALGNTPVQEVNAGKTFYNCHVGVVMTNSTFTPGAISLANATNVLLWDRSTLAELMRNEQPAAEKTVEVPVEVPPTAQPKDAVPAEVKATSVAPTPQVNPRQDMQQSLKKKKSIRIDNIGIDIDVTSTDRFGIVLENFGVERDEDDDDQLELLFDIVNRNGRTIRCDINIVCNLYAGCRKVTTERETVYKDSFDGRDSVSIYFDKKNISKTATRIELFCQKW